MEKTYIDGLVSVIVPVYNAEKYLADTLRSVFEQDYPDIEIVLVDDCSKDKSADTIADLQKTHPEIVCYHQEKNMGAGAARNKALELARGQYAAFLDSDDIWLPGKISRQIQLMKTRHTPFSYTAIEMMDEEGKTIKGKRNVKETCDYQYLLRNTMIATSSVVIDRTALGDFRMPLRRGGQDYATWLMLLRNGTVAQGINEALVRYRVAARSLSSNKCKSIRQVWEIQTQYEKINKISAAVHVLCFGYNAFKKYFL